MKGDMSWVVPIGQKLDGCNTFVKRTDADNGSGFAMSLEYLRKIMVVFT